ncbi:tyrosine recombinase XerC [Zeimonas arvi]|uniref:Tyrosine recombinase XerC n=1 Tax=Zeimonas arvi TaxID=2498847 RepID=A0A5C8NWD6_9BURK|nr:tyrosine recombinase XerC [Zeimonas arvi]TXL65372.1 tyrosine recombinase XerC [Zeimonas arvi]
MSQVDRYLLRLAAERGCSPRTIAGYRADLAILARLAEKGPSAAVATAAAAAPEAARPPPAEPRWTSVGEHALRRWIAAESRAGRAPRSIARRLSAWRGFYDWLSAEGLAAANPARGVRAPRASKRLPKALSPDQAASLMQAAPSDDFESLRDAAMLELLYSSGLRLSELTSLDVRYFEGRESDDRGAVAGAPAPNAPAAPSASWYAASESEVTVTGKGGRRRTVPVGALAREALGRWIAARADWLAAHPAADPRPLFLSAQGRRLANRTVQARLRRLAIERGIPAKVHPHVLRHSFASHLLQSSGDLRAVQELLGHASIATTQIYTSLDFQRLAAVYDAAHPRARKR